MPQFRYTAIDKTGHRTTQKAFSSSVEELQQQLAAQELTVVAINVEASNVNNKLKLTQQDQIYFSQNISILLTSGMSLGEVMRTITEDAPSKSAGIIFASLHNQLEQGATFAEALRQYPRAFDKVFVALVEAGEASGHLAEVLSNIADHTQRMSRISSQAKNAMMYPSFIFGALVMLTLMIAYFVIPKITTVFTSLNVKLPITTKILVAGSSFLIKSPLLSIGTIIILVVSILIFAKSRRGSQIMLRLIMIIPQVKRVMLFLDLSRYCGTMSLLLTTGVPFQIAMQISSEIIHSPTLKKDFERITNNLMSGHAIKDLLQQSHLPKSLISLIDIGEKSGSLDKIFALMGEHYESQFENNLKGLVSLIEPVMTLLVGLVVAGVVLSIITPIYQTVGSLGASADSAATPSGGP